MRDFESLSSNFFTSGVAPHPIFSHTYKRAPIHAIQDMYKQHISLLHITHSAAQPISKEYYSYPAKYKIKSDTNLNIMPLS